MDDPLPPSVDLVVVGTGLGEAMLAAAAARSGCSVLHVDECAYYGGEWASFNLHTMEEWIERERKRGEEESTDEVPSSLVKEGEVFRRISRRPTITNLRDEWTKESAGSSLKATAAPEPAASVAASEESEPAADSAPSAAAAAAPTWREAVEDLWRRFSLDITPKVLLSRGDLVNTLCDSEVSAYAEFKLVDRLLGITVSDADSSIDIHRIPCSRGEIFDTQALSMLDKRRLMNLLKLCVQWHAKPEECAEITDAASTPFIDFLAARNIEGPLAHLLTRSLSFLCPAVETPNTEESLKALCRFMDSVGVFGTSPFLVPLYGSGELPQCFARLSAVFGGVYCLGRKMGGIVEKEGRVIAVIVAGERVECQNVLMTSAFTPEDWTDTAKTNTVTRAILIANGSVKKEEKESISLVNLGALAQAAGARLLEVGWEGCTAPRGYYLGQFTAAGERGGLIDEVIDRMYGKDTVEGGRPTLLRRIQWIQREVLSNEKVPENVGVLRLPDATADYKSVMEEAKSIFARFWPDRDFLPRALKPAQEEEMDPFDAREEDGDKKDTVAVDAAAGGDVESTVERKD